MKKGLFMALTALLVLTGCSQTATPTQPNNPSTGQVKLQLDSKHKPFETYMKQASPIVQETYIMASKDPKALSAAPCYCGCYEQDGHTSVLDCFVDKMGPNGEVLAWDSMGVG